MHKHSENGTTVELPYLKPTDVLSHLMDSYPWVLLGGLKPGLPSQQMLATFWKLYKEEHGSHAVYTMAENQQLNLEFTIPLVLHGDGGKTLKKQPLEVVSLSPILGLDTHGKSLVCRCECPRTYSGKRKASPMAQRTNGRNNSYLTHYLLFAYPSKKYKKTPGLLKSLLGKISNDLGTLCERGLQYQGNFYNFAVLGMRGDLEYHAKSGLLKRSYMNVGHRNPIPCCSECLAGGPGVEFEDFSRSAAWRATLYSSAPWDGLPPFSSIPFEDWTGGSAARFFKRDPLHIFRLGISRQFIASSIVLLCIQGFFDHEGDGCGIDDRLGRAYAGFMLFCDTNSLKPAGFRSFSRQKLHLPTLGSFPYIGCKGSDVPILLKWLLFFTRLNLIAKPGDLTLLLISAGCDSGLGFQGIYRHGVWLQSTCRAKLEKDLERFLGSYARLAALTYQQGYQLYAMVPKAHALDHIKYSLELGNQKEFTCNPSVWDCSMSEDLVGHISRQSRRVSHVHVVANTLLAYKVRARFVLERFKKARHF